MDVLIIPLSLSSCLSSTFLCAPTVGGCLCSSMHVCMRVELNVSHGKITVVSQTYDRARDSTQTLWTGLS